MQTIQTPPTSQIPPPVTPRLASVPAQSRAPAARARPRRRHWLAALSFALMVLLPIGATGTYLYRYAADQYASYVAFTVRQEETPSAVDILGGITTLGANGSSDTDILFEFIQSQQLVAGIDANLDLRAIYANPGEDWYFSLDQQAEIEGLVDYWQDMVQIYYDSKTRLIQLRVLAFTPDDATRVATEIFDQSSVMINGLSDAAREDATRYARDEVDKAVARLKDARQALTEFRTTNQIVDPAADLQGQMGLLSSLQQQLADALIEQDMLHEVSRAGDPRIDQARRKISVIEARIAQERMKLSTTQGGSEAFASIVGRYEAFKVDVEFAERAYFGALAAHDTAQAEARRKSRYLAAYVEPTRAQAAMFPQRELRLGLVAMFSLLGWAVLMLIAYSVKDRR